MRFCSAPFFCKYDIWYIYNLVFYDKIKTSEYRSFRLYIYLGYIAVKPQRGFEEKQNIDCVFNRSVVDVRIGTDRM